MTTWIMIGILITVAVAALVLATTDNSLYKTIAGLIVFLFLLVGLLGGLPAIMWYGIHR